MLELAAYVLLTLVAVLQAVRLPYVNLHAVSLAASLGFMVIVRASGFEEDMEIYAAHLTYDSVDLIFYYAREPVFWLLAPKFAAGFRALGLDAELTFLIYDTACLVLIWAAIKRFRLPPYVTTLIVLSFPMLMAYQNVYREFLGLSALLFALATALQGRFVTANITFLVAVLAHNAAGAFLPALMALLGRTAKGTNGLLIAAAGLASVPFSMIAVFFGLASKSSEATAADLSLPLALSVAIGFAITTIICPSPRAYRPLLVGGWVTALAFLVLVLGSSAASERVSTMGLIVLLPSICASLERLRPLWIGTMAIVLVFAAVTIAAPSARQFLL